jgi:hypothetical protein
MDVSMRLRRDWTMPGAPDALVLPGSLCTLIERIHGDEGMAAFEVPTAYATFLHEHGGGFYELEADGTKDPYGWGVFTWEQALNATEAEYERYCFDPEGIDEDRESSVRCLVEAGVWLHVGTRARHDHFLCCDHRRAAFGRVVDLNDGHPAFGLVSDIEWRSFEDYIGDVRR